MFRHLLVPLDGSSLAEAALPPAAYLAARLDATVTLVHIIERAASTSVHGERHLTTPDEACAYLGEVSANVFPSSVRAERHVHTAEVDDVAVGIANHIEELGPDLIVMCTHGRGGLRDVLYGSIAQQVVSHGTVPVLLIRPNVDRRPAEFNCHRLLVPMDATARHEQGLSAGAEIARACEATLHLLLVVPTIATLSGDEAGVGRLLPVATHHLLEMSCQEAEKYLLGYAAQLQRDGIAAHVELARGEPAAVIVDTAERLGADVIVLGTHGRSGIEAFWSGSVAPKVSRRCRLPLLLVPVARGEDTAVRES